jgi:hypothetical protein
LRSFEKAFQKSETKGVPMKTGFALIALLSGFFAVAGLFGIVAYGLYLAFSASVLLGVLVLVLEPAPFVLGVVGVLGHPEIARQIATWLGV